MAMEKLLSMTHEHERWEKDVSATDATKAASSTPTCNAFQLQLSIVMCLRLRSTKFGLALLKPLL